MYILIMVCQGVAALIYARPVSAKVRRSEIGALFKALGAASKWLEENGVKP